MLGRIEDCLRMRRDVYSGCVKHHGEEQVDTLRAANNYAKSLIDTLRFTEAKNLLRKKRPVARRSLGENDETTLRMRWYYAVALYMEPGAALDDLREAATTLEELEPYARRVLGGAHPLAEGIEQCLGEARAALNAREPPPRGA